MNRQLLEYHPTIGYRFIPSLKTREEHEGGGFLLQSNRAGYRCRHEFEVKKDPRLTDVTEADLVAQFELAREIRDRESAANGGVIFIRDLKAQVADRLSQADSETLREMAHRFVERISAVESELYQVRNQSPKDKIAFPIKLNDRLTGLRSLLELGDAAPSQAYHRVFEELSQELTTHLAALEQVLLDDLPRLNEALEGLRLPPIAVGPRRTAG